VTKPSNPTRKQNGADTKEHSPYHAFENRVEGGRDRHTPVVHRGEAIKPGGGEQKTTPFSIPASSTLPPLVPTLEKTDQLTANARSSHNSVDKQVHGKQLMHAQVNRRARTVKPNELKSKDQVAADNFMDYLKSANANHEQERPVGLTARPR